MFLPSAPDLPASGAAALYAPDSQDPSLALADQVIDFVQWGAAGGPNESTANSALLWPTGQFVPAVAAAHSIELCDFTIRRGAAAWGEIALPNFGSYGNCVTPAIQTIWGFIQQRYR